MDKLAKYLVWSFLGLWITIYILMVIFLMSNDAIADGNVNMNPKCHKEVTLTKDADGLYEVNVGNTIICESTPSDWKSEDLF